MNIYWIKNNGIESGPHRWLKVINRNGFNVSNPKESNIIAAGGLIEPERPTITETQRIEIDLVDGVLVWNVIDSTLEELAAEIKAAIPTVISKRQAVEYLYDNGMYEMVMTELADMGEKAVLVWNAVVEIDRNHDLVKALSFTEDQKDIMFSEAGTL